MHKRRQHLGQDLLLSGLNAFWPGKLKRHNSPVKALRSGLLFGNGSDAARRYRYRGNRLVIIVGSVIFGHVRELYLAALIVAEQTVLDRKIDSVEHRFLVREPHLGLCRGDVRVKQRRIKIDTQHTRRKFPDHYAVAERLLKRRAAERAFHAPPVYEKVLHGTVRSREQRRADIARHAYIAVDVVDGYHSRRELLAEHRVNSAVILPVTRREHGLLSIADKPERNIRVRQS